MVAAPPPFWRSLVPQGDHRIDPQGAGVRVCGGASALLQNASGVPRVARPRKEFQQKGIPPPLNEVRCASGQRSEPVGRRCGCRPLPLSALVHEEWGPTGFSTDKNDEKQK